MSTYRGDEFMLEVDVSETETPDWAVVNDLNSFSKSSQRNTQSFPVFQRAVAHTMVGAREQTYSIGGYFNPDDEGQAKLFEAEAANTTVTIRVTQDGTNGFTQDVKVGSITYDADPEGLQEVTFEFTADGASSVVGTGIAF